MLKRIKAIIVSFKNKFFREANRSRNTPRTKDHWLTYALNNKDSEIARYVNKSRSILQKYHPAKTWYDDELPSIFFIINDYITKVLKYKVAVKKRGDCNELFVICYINSSTGCPIVSGSCIETPERCYSIAILKAYRNLLVYWKAYSR